MAWMNPSINLAEGYADGAAAACNSTIIILGVEMCNIDEMYSIEDTGRLRTFLK